jgi:methylenetetrahydrofolate reductase (NADPH)
MLAVPLSFEFFPPKTDALADQLWQALQQLKQLNPAFVSVTYGAGGSTRQRTQELVARICQDAGVAEAAAHLTCVGASRDEIAEVVEAFWQVGVRHIVALRGDAPQNIGQADGQAGGYQPHPQGYAYAADLVAGLRQQHPFKISVAAYPETHPEAISPQADLDNLKRKFDNGADQAITQFFFDAELYPRFVERARAIGITQPIIPGVLPIHQFAQMERFAGMCGANVPNWLRQQLADLQPDSPAFQAAAAEQCAQLCRQLLAYGAPALHFYTLNRAPLLLRVIGML